MTTDEFYKEPPPGASPGSQQRTTRGIPRNGEDWPHSKADGCGYIFPEDDTDPCSKHYAISKKEKEDIDGEYDAMSQDPTRQQNPDHFTQTYGPTLGPEILARGDKLRAAKDAGAVSMAHQLRAGGGCPIGEGNLKPVEPKCYVSA